MSQILLEHEELVFNVIEEYLNENRTFDLEKIFSFLNSRFSKSLININNEGIWKILISLMEKKLVIDGTKLTKKELLDYPRRKKICDYINNNSGKVLNKIAKALGMSSGVVYWHIKLLLKFQLIKKVSIDNHIVYFPSNIELRDAEKLYLISKDKSKKIINYLKINNFGISKTQLSTDLKIHHKTINKYLKSLEGHNIITKEKRSNKTLYFLKDF